MNALTTGALIILYLLISQSIAAYVESQTDPDFNFDDGCGVTDNSTTCQDVSEDTFLDAVLSVTVNGFNGAWEWFNLLWVAVNVFLLSLAIILIVSYFIGLVFGGAS